MDRNVDYVSRAATEPLGFGLLPSIAPDQPMPWLSEIDAAAKVIDERLRKG